MLKMLKENDKKGDPKDFPLKDDSGKDLAEEAKTAMEKAKAQVNGQGFTRRTHRCGEFVAGGMYWRGNNISTLREAAVRLPKTERSPGKAGMAFPNWIKCPLFGAAAQMSPQGLIHLSLCPFFKYFLFLSLALSSDP